MLAGFLFAQIRLSGQQSKYVILAMIFLHILCCGREAADFPLQSQTLFRHHSDTNRHKINTQTLYYSKHFVADWSQNNHKLVNVVFIRFSASHTLYCQKCRVRTRVPLLPCILMVWLHTFKFFLRPFLLKFSPTSISLARLMFGETLSSQKSPLAARTLG